MLELQLIHSNEWTVERRRIQVICLTIRFTDIQANGMCDPLPQGVTLENIDKTDRYLTRENTIISTTNNSGYIDG